MWTAFKLLTWKAKAGVFAAILAILLVLGGTISYVSYQKGLNVSRVEIGKYESNVNRILAAAQKIQRQVDVRVVTQYKDRVNTIDRIVYKTRTVVETTVPEQFNLSRGWIYAYNQSVQGLELDPAKASDKTASTVSEMRALAATIVPNNGICLINKAQLDSLQTWVRDTEKASASVK